MGNKRTDKTAEYAYHESCNKFLENPETGKKTKETFAKSTMSQRLSPAFKDLDFVTRDLFACMKQEASAMEYNASLLERPIDEESNKEGLWAADFYFPQSYAFKKYECCSGNAHTFKDCIEDLVRHGFIDIIRTGGYTAGTGKLKGVRQKAVYRFSDRWKEWEWSPTTCNQKKAKRLQRNLENRTSTPKIKEVV